MQHCNMRFCLSEVSDPFERLSIIPHDAAADALTEMSGKNT